MNLGFDKRTELGYLIGYYNAMFLVMADGFNLKGYRIVLVTMCAEGLNFIELRI